MVASLPRAAGSATVRGGRWSAKAGRTARRRRAEEIDGGPEPGGVGEGGEGGRIGNPRGLGTAARMAAGNRQDDTSGPDARATVAAAGCRQRRRAGRPHRRQDAN